MAEIRIDGKTYAADASKNLLDVCLSVGLDLPYFCWHPERQTSSRFFDASAA